MKCKSERDYFISGFLCSAAKTLTECIYSSDLCIYKEALVEHLEHLSFLKKSRKRQTALSSQRE